MSISSLHRPYSFYNGLSQWMVTLIDFFLTVDTKDILCQLDCIDNALEFNVVRNDITELFFNGLFTGFRSI